MTEEKALEITAGGNGWSFERELIRAGIDREVREEQHRQDAKWGQQDHKDGTGENERVLWEIGEQLLGYSMINVKAHDLAVAASEATDRFAQAADLSWADILLEEVFEALAERDRTKLRAELIQVAAVAHQWIAKIDRDIAAEEGLA